MGGPRLQQGLALLTRTVKSLWQSQPQRRKGDAYCNEWMQRDSACKPKCFPQVSLYTSHLCHPQLGKDATPTNSTFKLNEFWQQSWQLSMTAMHEDCLHLLTLPAILPTKEQQLLASWFIPPPYVQLSVCMTIKNKATYIMALKHITNQLHPLPYYNIQNAWLPWCAEKGKHNQTTRAIKWCRALVTGSKSFLL